MPGDPEYCTTPGCFEGLTPNPKYPLSTVAYPVDPLTTQAKILIFIAACVMGRKYAKLAWHYFLRWGAHWWLHRAQRTSIWIWENMNGSALHYTLTTFRG